MFEGKKIIALCLSRINDSVSREFTASLNEIAAKNDWRLFVYITCSDLYWNTPEERGEASVFSIMDYDIIDAVIIMEEKLRSRETVEGIARKAAEKNVPVISIGRRINGCKNLLFDYSGGFDRVIDHVIDCHGVTDLHLIAGIKGNSFSDSRIDAFRCNLERRGLHFSDDMVSYGDFWTVPAAAAVKKLIDENRLPKALICANDTMAIAACGTLRENGYRVPEDVIVTGFDGIEDIKFSEPHISSCMCDFGDMAEKAARVIENEFEGIKDNSTETIIPRLIISESCGCREERAVNVSNYLNDINNRFYRYQEECRTFNTITARVYNCKSVEEVANQFPSDIVYNMCCVLKHDTINEAIDPLSNASGDFDDEELFMLFNTDIADGFRPASFPAKDIFPGMRFVLDRKMPLIFAALNFIDVPLGYVCFFYNDYHLNNYCRMPQTIYYINMAIGGYRNMRYQNYLARRLEETYKSDALTGLYNRSGFIREYDRLIERSSGVVTVALADLDGLKYINDNFGHGEGDIAIRTVAQALKAACPQGAVCARFGGDEMIAVIEGECTEPIRERLNAFLEDYSKTSGKPYSVAASLGIYVSRDESKDFEELMKKSDKLMYKDKLERKKKRDIWK